MAKLLMACGVQGDKGKELDKGRRYEIGPDVSEKFAANLVATGFASIVPDNVKDDESAEKAKGK